MLKSYDYQLLKDLNTVIGKLNDHFAKCPAIPYDCMLCPKESMCTQINRLMEASSTLSRSVQRFQEDMKDLYD